MKISLSALLALLLCACASLDRHGSVFDQTQFETLLTEVSGGWSTNDAARAAAAFAPNAIYSEPPDRQLYVGRKALFEFFGGSEGRDNEMSMIWRHISFDSGAQIGAAEFTFEYDGGVVHGMVSIKIENGLIANWREYYYETDLDWQTFQGSNIF